MISIRAETWGCLTYSRQYQAAYQKMAPLGLSLDIGKRQTISDDIPIVAESLPSNTVPLSGPVIVGFQITRACNLRCRYCFAQPIRRDSSPSTRAAVVELLTRILELNPLAIWISGGEPTLSMDLPQVLRALSEVQIPTSVDTNGTKISPELIECFTSFPLITVRVSLDSFEQAIQNHLRGQAYSTISGINNLLRAGIHITINTVITRYNVNQLMDFYSKLVDLGVKRWILYELVQAGRAINTYNELSVSDFSLTKLNQVNRNRGHPMSIIYVQGNRPRTTVLVNREGFLYTVSGPKRLLAGNILDTSPAELWKKLELDSRAHLEKYLCLSRS